SALVAVARPARGLVGAAVARAIAGLAAPLRGALVRRATGAALDARRCRRRLLRSFDDRGGKIAIRLRGDAFAELIAERPRLDLLCGALREVAELEWPEGEADQPFHLQPDMLEHVAHFAVLAFADREGEPHIGALLAVERRFDRPVMDSRNRDPVAQPIEVVLRDAAERAHPIAAQPAGFRQLEHTGEP